MTGGTKAQLNLIMEFTLKLYAHVKGDPTAMADLDATAMADPLLPYRHTKTC